MAANDAVQKLTLRLPRDLYDRMHAITEARGAEHNAFIVKAIERMLALEERVEVVRAKLLRRDA